MRVWETELIAAVKDVQTELIAAVGGVQLEALGPLSISPLPPALGGLMKGPAVARQTSINQQPMLTRALSRRRRRYRDGRLLQMLRFESPVRFRFLRLA
jgi:hypothetical protein